ncbi:hypothetical protein GCM10010168_74300 [Actinoplanes ianthinogenes]|uniref:Uncharacterized protein n=1 Tax=Actinoplanes ianthinogenes TaxID=122358 RepID=A0ABM7LMZ2_9ACTN|nr:hypothetical protein [Actinoplanes ianthinogenes]BCJ40582.1 hypothetical protein Aiant_12390 [Actinoplanes ianthinogenes]GGR44347.1 hypothetical protein GCM10010168_74300 [Actinoplanes ianthinogenes]
MRTRKKLSLFTAGFLTLLTGAALAPAAAVAAVGPTVTTLPFTHPSDVVSAGSRVFVSGGPDSKQIAVTDAVGTVTGSIDGLDGPTKLQLSTDRRTLYVTLRSAGKIAAFDTGSLRRTATWNVGEGTCPSSLAYTGRYVWFGYGCEDGKGNIGRIDLLRGPTLVTKGLADTDFYYPPLLASAVRNTRVLLAGERSLSPSVAIAYAIGVDGKLTRTSETTWENSGSNGADLALDPAGATAFKASGSPYHVQSFPVENMAKTGTAYETGSYPSAVDVSRDGTRVAGGVFAWYDPDVFVFNLDGTVVTQFELGGTDHTLTPGALAWSPDGSLLYALSDGGYPYTTPAQLHVLPVPAA